MAWGAREDLASHVIAVSICIAKSKEKREEKETGGRRQDGDAETPSGLAAVG